jgi:6-phosphogluconolactonase
MPYARIDAADDHEFAMKATVLLSKQIQFFIKEHGNCLIGLSGGSTPKPVYQMLAKEKGIDWSRVTLFLVDDRYVPSDHSDSNVNLINTALLSHLHEKPHVIFPHTHLPLEECVTNYDDRLSEVLMKDTADIVVLGMGDDGHIASLFPPLTDEAFEPELFAIHNTTERFNVRDRISVTMPVLVKAKIAVFLLKGEEKKRVWDTMINDKRDSRRWPAQAVLAEERSFAVIG